jgi:hypothetical protein
MYRSQNLGGGGIIIAVKDNFITSEVPEFETDCGITWCNLDIVGHKSLYLSCFYNLRTSTRNDEGYVIYGRSMERLNSRVNNTVVISSIYPELTGPTNQSNQELSTPEHNRGFRHFGRSWLITDCRSDHTRN